MGGLGLPHAVAIVGTAMGVAMKRVGVREGVRLGE